MAGAERLGEGLRGQIRGHVAVADAVDEVAQYSGLVAIVERSERRTGVAGSLLGDELLV